MYLRSALAPLVALLTVAVAYLVSIRTLAAVGQRFGISIPAEVEPIVVALPSGVAVAAGSAALGIAQLVLQVLPAVLLAVALVLAVPLRAIVAPVYLVLLAAPGPLAALGLAVGLFQGILGYPELTFFVPLAAGVLLVALGSDDNICSSTPSSCAPC